MHAAGADERAADVQTRGEGKDRRVFRSLMCEQVRHDAAHGEHDQFGARDAVGERHGGFHGLVLVRFQRRIAREAAGGIFFLDAADHGVEHLDALQWVAAHRRLTAEHDAVHLLDDRIEDVRDLRAGRHGVFDHAFEHLRGHDDLAAVIRAALHDLALDDGQFLDGHLAAEIATRDHDAAAGLDERVDVVERLLVFNFGDHARLAAFLLDEQLQMLHVSGLAGEAQREVIDAQLHTEVEIRVVLLRQRRQAHGHAGQIDVAAGFHLPLRQNGADDVLGGHFGRLDLDHAAIDHDHVARFEVFAELRVVHHHRILRARLCLRFAAKLDRVAHLELPGLLDIAGANARPGEVHEHRDFMSAAGRGLADSVVDAAHPVVRAMAHVEAENVRARADELGDRFETFRGGTERAENFGFAHVEAGMEQGAGRFKSANRQKAAGNSLRRLAPPLRGRFDAPARSNRSSPRGLRGD